MTNNIAPITMQCMHVAVFLFAVAACIKRKEAGFVFLALAFALEALGPIDSLLSRFNGGRHLIPMVPVDILLFGSAGLLLVGMALLVCGKKSA